MLLLVIRTLILYIVVVVSVRIMGKRQIGEMQPSELVVAIMISDLASVPMQSADIPLSAGIVPVLTLIFTEMAVAYLCLKSKKARRIITGKPSILMYNGKIDREELKKQRFNLNDLTEQLRINGYPSLSDVEAAVLETNGQLSVIPKKDARPATVRDLGIENAQKESLPCIIISDGVLVSEELKRGGRNEEWLKEELKQRGINNYNDVFVASLDYDGRFFVQKREY